LGLAGNGVSSNAATALPSLYTPRVVAHGDTFDNTAAVLTLYGSVPTDVTGRGFTVPVAVSLRGPNSVLRLDQTDGTLWSESTLRLTNANLDRHWYKKWYFEFSWTLFYFLFIKIKYKGKSYKWYRRNKSLVLRFGYSHLVALRIPDAMFARRAGKMKLVFFGTNRYEIRRFLSESISWRPMNIYNGRGLRFARQLVFRKFGKVSAYR
jgi:hypothetical protein